MPGHFYDKNARRTSWPGKLMSFFYLLILIIGIVVLIKTCLIRSNLNEINKIDENTAYIDNLCVNVLIVGSLLVTFGLIGILSIYCLNKCLITFSSIILISMLIFHVYFLVNFNRNNFKDNFKEKLQKTIDNLNSNNSNVIQDCTYMKSISRYYFCCGYNSKTDFILNKTALECCVEEDEPGCAQIVTEKIKEIINNLISPSIVVFCIEIIFIFSSFNICLCSQKACYTVI
jgi:hypothetical protein